MPFLRLHTKIMVPCQVEMFIGPLATVLRCYFRYGLCRNKEKTLRKFMPSTWLSKIKPTLPKSNKWFDLCDKWLNMRFHIRGIWNTSQKQLEPLCKEDREGSHRDSLLKASPQVKTTRYLKRGESTTLYLKTQQTTKLNSPHTWTCLASPLP